ncbi:MAG: TIGR02996 domain-containing protein [Fimbriiglobus sp.]|jgi:uncharacterized protein (TIGR02996 family)|nr:TIGR02996 domain-containing protein [Fimbriiglobus sp.]
MNSDESAFLAGIRAEPRDDLRRLVYADWLEEQGTDEYGAKAEYLRLEVHVSGLPDDHPERDGHILKLRAVAGGLPIDWKTAVAKVAIENCNVRWRFQCPKKWSELATTSEDTVRWCTACRKEVHFCETVEEARNEAESQGHCVAIDLGVIRKPGDMDLIRGPAELDSEMTMGDIIPVEDFNPGAPGFAPPPPANPGLLARLWRRFTGK